MFYNLFMRLALLFGLIRLERRDRAHTDAMVDRLEKEIAERQAFIEGTVANAQDSERDLTDSENELITEARKRIESVEQQLESLNAARATTRRARQRVDELNRAMAEMRHEVDSGPVEYRSAGEYVVDAIQARLGSRDALQRMEFFERQTQHQTTADNPGVVPDPIVGEVVNFIDAARPIVSFVGPRPMTDHTWYRPKVTTRGVVGLQGSSGDSGDEKTELPNQKMQITRLTGKAVTYGGYANVSRQNIDFSSPQVMDIVINDLASQYAIQTEAAACAQLAATNTGGVGYDPAEEGSITAALWQAAATAYSAVKGQGRLVLAIAPDVLSVFGPLFAPVNPRDSQSPGFEAGRFGQGVMGSISGIPAVMTTGLQAGEAFLFSTAAFEVYEQRVGTLQVVEPSVLGVQVAYAGYFTPMTIEAGGIVPLDIESSGSS